MSSGFKYKGTDLNDMIGSAITQQTSTQFIKDATSNTTLSQYYNPLTNSSGPVSNTSIARLYNPTLYTIPGSIDVRNYVIAKYNDYTVGSHEAINNKPAWSNACSIFIIGAGGSGASGTQGFSPQGGQAKNAQQGNCGGGGGGGGVIICPFINLKSPMGTNISSIQIVVGDGGAATPNIDTSGSPGQITQVYMQNSGQQIGFNYDFTANGGDGGIIGQQTDTGVGTGGLGGNTQSVFAFGQGSSISYTGISGQNGSSPGPSNASLFTYCNGGPINDTAYSNYLPIQIISNGGGNQMQTQIGQQTTTFANVQGYGAGGAGGAGGNQSGAGPSGSQGGKGAPGFVRIYWLNTN